MVRFVEILFYLAGCVCWGQEVFRNTARYDGYQMISVVPHTEDQAWAIYSLQDDPEFDFYSTSRRPETPSTILIPPTKIEGVVQFLQELGMEVQVEVEDYQKQIDEEQARLMDRYLRNGNKFDFNISDFNTYEDIMSELDTMALNCPADCECTTYVIGQSYEGRDIKGLYLRPKGGDELPAYWLDSLIHPREWLAGATLLKIMDYMIYNMEGDPDVDRLLQYAWFFVPVMNPDGYVFTWTDDRNWRKNRSPNNSSTCMGTDLNRNYAFMWGNDGSSVLPCSNSYMGASPESEVETQVMQAEYNRLGSRLLALVSIHTQGQMWLTAWGHTEDGACAFPPDYDDLLFVADAMADATQATFGTTWTRGSICTTIYPASGSSIDNAKAQSGVKYVYAPELRGMSFPNEASIEPSFRETWNGIVAMVDAIAEREGGK